MLADCVATLTALVEAGARLTTVLYKEAHRSHLMMLETLIDLGAKPNARKGEALAVTIRFRKVEAMELLLRRGARVDGVYGDKAAGALGYGREPVGDIPERLVAAGIDPALIRDDLLRLCGPRGTRR